MQLQTVTWSWSTFVIHGEIEEGQKIDGLDTFTIAIYELL